MMKHLRESNEFKKTKNMKNVSFNDVILSAARCQLATTGCLWDLQTRLQEGRILTEILTCDSKLVSFKLGQSD